MWHLSWNISRFATFDWPIRPKTTASKTLGVNSGPRLD